MNTILKRTKLVLDKHTHETKKTMNENGASSVT